MTDLEAGTSSGPLEVPVMPSSEFGRGWRAVDHPVMVRGALYLPPGHPLIETVRRMLTWTVDTPTDPKLGYIRQRDHIPVPTTEHIVVDDAGVVSTAEIPSVMDDIIEEDTDRRRDAGDQAHRTSVSDAIIDHAQSHEERTETTSERMDRQRNEAIDANRARMAAQSRVVPTPKGRSK
jgi:hypothetical protein